jgi:polysaccharide deacetylase family protein (PEP-CTERM system associated)
VVRVAFATTNYMKNSPQTRQLEVTIRPELAGKCIFSVDVEDWFHILQVPGAPGLEAWDGLPSVVEANFMRMLDLFDTADVRVTCFFLGWIARRYPQLVAEAFWRGHEIASHGYAHRLVFEMTEREFREDALLARRVLEDVTGSRVIGYRSAGFSATDKTPWFFRALIEAGYEYDSSVFPATRQHGGISGASRVPHVVWTESGSMLEFPISVVDALGRATCFFGGGYLRLFPYAVIGRMARRVIREGRPVIFYIHPREIDPGHPRLPMPLHRRFKSYINLRSTEGKIQRIISEFPMATFQEFLDRPAIVSKAPIAPRHKAAAAGQKG